MQEYIKLEIVFVKHHVPNFAIQTVLQYNILANQITIFKLIGCYEGLYGLVSKSADSKSLGISSLWVRVSLGSYVRK